MDKIGILNDGRLTINEKESNFYIHEFVTPEVYERWGNQSLRYIQGPCILAAQFIRDISKTGTTINNYKFGGTYRDSGTRTLDSYNRMYGKDKGLPKYLRTYSMHKFCGAIDLKIGNMSSEDMATIVLDNEEALMEIGIRRMENPLKTVSKHGKKGRDWLHLDTGNSSSDFIIQVDP